MDDRFDDLRREIGRFHKRAPVAGLYDLPDGAVHVDVDDLGAARSITLHAASAMQRSLPKICTARGVSPLGPDKRRFRLAVLIHERLEEIISLVASARRVSGRGAGMRRPSHRPSARERAARRAPRFRFLPYGLMGASPQRGGWEAPISVKRAFVIGHGRAPAYGSARPQPCGTI